MARAGLGGRSKAPNKSTRNMAPSSTMPIKPWFWYVATQLPSIGSPSSAGFAAPTTPPFVIPEPRSLLVSGRGSESTDGQTSVRPDKLLTCVAVSPRTSQEEIRGDRGTTTVTMTSTVVANARLALRL